MYDLIKIVATAFLSLSTGVGLTYYKYHLDNKKKPGTTFDADLDRRNRVKEFLIEVFSEFRPARDACYLLHNGGILFNGDHMQRIKLYEEQTRDKEVPVLRRDFDSVLIEGGLHQWIDMMRKAKKKGPYEEVCLQHNDENHIPSELLAFLEYYGMYSVYSMLLRNPQTNAPIGIFAVSYDVPTPITASLLVGLRQHAKRLEKILLKK